MNCPHCDHALDAEVVLSAAAQLLAGRRAVKSGGRRKLSDRQRSQLLDRLRNNESPTALAREFGVSPGYPRLLEKRAKKGRKKDDSA